MIYFLTAIVLSPAGRSTVHIYTQTIYRTIQKNNTYVCTKQIVLTYLFEGHVGRLQKMKNGTYLRILNITVGMNTLASDNRVFASVHDHWLKIFNSCKVCSFPYARNFMCFTHETRIRVNLNKWFSNCASPTPTGLRVRDQYTDSPWKV